MVAKPNQPPHMSAYPSPPFLCTPAKDQGKPSPEDLILYKAYLRYQLRRGVSPKATMRMAAVEYGERFRRLGEGQYLCLKALLNGSMQPPEIAERTRLALGDVIRHLANCRKRRLVCSVQSAVTGRYGTWSITPVGRDVLQKVRCEHGQNPPD